MRTTRLREKIKKFLERGQANTTEILEHVNSTMRHGTTPQQLGNVLSKDKDIRKIATTKRGGALSGRYEICVWTLRDDERILNSKDDFILRGLMTKFLLLQENSSWSDGEVSLERLQCPTSTIATGHLQEVRGRMKMSMANERFQ